MLLISEYIVSSFSLTLHLTQKHFSIINLKIVELLGKSIFYFIYLGKPECDS